MMLDDPRRRLLDLLAQKSADPEGVASALRAVAAADGGSGDPVAPDPTDVAFAEAALAAAALRGRFAPDDRDIPKGCGGFLAPLAATVVQDGRALLALKTGPRMKRKWRLPPSPSSRISEPMMSAGIRSGVHCTRLSSSPSTVPSVSTNRVLARPGTPMSKA